MLFFLGRNERYGSVLDFIDEIMEVMQDSDAARERESGAEE